MQIQSDMGQKIIDVSKGLSLGASMTQQPLPVQEQLQVEQPSVEHSVNSMQKSLEFMKETNFQVGFDHEIDRVIVKYTNAYGEVVRQIPSQDFVDFEKEFVKAIGLLFDKKV